MAAARIDGAASNSMAAQVLGTGATAVLTSESVAATAAAAAAAAAGGLQLPGQAMTSAMAQSSGSAPTVAAGFRSVGSEGATVQMVATSLGTASNMATRGTGHGDARVSAAGPGPGPGRGPGAVQPPPKKRRTAVQREGLTYQQWLDMPKGDGRGAGKGISVCWACCHDELGTMIPQGLHPTVGVRVRKETVLVINTGDHAKHCPWCKKCWGSGKGPNAELRTKRDCTKHG